MTDAFQATFSDFRIVKGRKVCQVVLEVALEQADAALRVLGGVPNPSESRWVAVARLNTTPAPEKPKGKTASQRAWALCQSGAFGRWLTDEEFPDTNFIADALRKTLGITSRGELDTNPEARARFEQLEREYKEASR